MEEELLNITAMAQDGQPRTACIGEVHLRGEELGVCVCSPRRGDPTGEQNRPLVGQSSIYPGECVLGGGENIDVIDIAAANQTRGFANGDQQCGIEAELLIQVRPCAHSDGAVLV